MLLATLGANLKLARARRGVTIEAAAEAIGTGIRAVREAERGNPATGIRVSIALLSLYGLGADVARLADPNQDVEGLRLGGPMPRERARRGARTKAALPKAARVVKTDPVPAQSLPDRVTRLLTREEVSALNRLQQLGPTRSNDLATALGLKPNRVAGLLRELRRKLHGLGLRDALSDESLPNGDVLFRLNSGRLA